MESHVEEVKDTARQCRELCRQKLAVVPQSLVEGLRVLYRAGAKDALSWIDDLLESAIARHEAHTRRVLAHETTVEELCAFDDYLLGDLARTIENCEATADKFVGLWTIVQ